MESVLAALGLAVSVLLLLRMAIGARRRQRVDAAALRGWRVLRRFAHATRHWRAARRASADASAATSRRTRSAEHLKVVPKSPQDKLH